MSQQIENGLVIEAYQAIAQEILAFVGKNSWDEAGVTYEIFGKMISSTWWSKYNGELDQLGNDIPRDVRKLAKEKIYFLRKHLFELTGDRIWGLTFTLYPTGKFNIHYDYNKPEGYEETDEFITGEEINKSFLQK